MKLFKEGRVYKSSLNNYYIVEDVGTVIICRNFFNAKTEIFDELGIGIWNREVLDSAIEFRYRKVWFPWFHKLKIGDICVTANKEQWVVGNIVEDRVLIFKGAMKYWVNRNELKPIKTLQKEIIYEI